MFYHRKDNKIIILRWLMYHRITNFSLQWLMYHCITIEFILRWLVDHRINNNNIIVLRCLDYHRMCIILEIILSSE